MELRMTEKAQTVFLESLEAEGLDLSLIHI